MNIVLDKQSTTKALLNISFEKEDFQPQVDKKLQEYGKQIQLRGFRPGKVPKAVVKKMYGKSILLEEANKLLSDALFIYIKENDLQVVGDPRPVREKEETNNWENPDVLEFQYELGLATPFEINPAAIELTKYKIVFDEKEIDENIEDYRKRFGESEEVESVADNDLVVITFEVEKDEKAENTESTSEEEAEAETAETPTATDQEDAPKREEEPSVELVEESEKTSFHKNFTASFIAKNIKEEWKSKVFGMKKGETYSLPFGEIFEGDLTDNLFLDQFSGDIKEKIQQETTSFSIATISRETLAEINEEFLGKILPEGEEKTEENLREIVRKQIEVFYEKEATAYQSIELKNKLIEQAAIEFPDEFLKEWLKESTRDKFTPEQVEEQYEDYARNLRWELILDKVILAKIKENEEQDDPAPIIDIQELKQAAVKLMFEHYGMPSNKDFTEQQLVQFDNLIQNFLKDDEGRNYQQAYNRAIKAKGQKLLLEQASFTEKNISIEDFIELAKNL